MSRDEIINMARESGLVSDSYVYDSTDEADWKDIERFAALVAAAEREACAQVLNENAKLCVRNKLLREILEANADAIRARGAA
jgi:hypothetical protein